MLKQKDHTFSSSQAGIGYTPHAPVRIVMKKLTNHCITADEDAQSIATKPSVFDRIGEVNQRKSVFDQLRPPNMIYTPTTPRRSIHERLGISSLSRTNKGRKQQSKIIFF